MPSVNLLGSFSYDHQSVEFFVNREDKAHSAIVEVCCKKMKTQGLKSMTIEFDHSSFIYFLKKGDHIRFIEGNNKDYPVLTSKVRLGLEGDLIPEEDLKEKEETEPKAAATVQVSPPSSDDLDTSLKEDHAIIHHSLYQSLDQFKRNYSNAELYFKPFEEPGGDFYWCRDYQYKSLVALGDCTGHGSLGAMIAMSVMTLLKQFFRLPPTSLKDALVEFHHQMKELMEEEILDTFDVELGVLLLDKRTNILTYSGSGVNMTLKSGDEVNSYRSRKTNIITGKVTEEQIQLKEGDQIFIYSDGILDQFDAKDEKRMGLKGLQQIVTNTHPQNTLSTFLKDFNSFRGKTEQLDDQTMLILTV
ncbi:PP2C family protein-serine/threonine phosphatase [Marinoscillum sp. MHG1-6]|uniref:PP2C family protein-serine/threonine phosphatase n=1 Tax=Marinoscillum sp. MHG1-6 TaxID=2959627 RepID=UPI00215711B2|nr:serine/threonine-protein phosphatase [Marinoscillum sp. MHG1-6]